MTVPTSPDDEIIPEDGRSHLYPGEVAHVARNVTNTAAEPLYKWKSEMETIMRRVFGDGEDPTIPPNMRNKGILFEMKEDADRRWAEQQEWKTADDKNKRIAHRERKRLQAEIKQLRDDFEHEKEKNHRMRALGAWAIEWLTSDKDKLSIAIGKIVALITFAGGFTGATAYGGWKLAVMIAERIHKH